MTHHACKDEHLTRRQALEFLKAVMRRHECESGAHRKAVDAQTEKTTVKIMVLAVARSVGCGDDFQGPVTIVSIDKGVGL